MWSLWFSSSFFVCTPHWSSGEAAMYGRISVINSRITIRRYNCRKTLRFRSLRARVILESWFTIYIYILYIYLLWFWTSVTPIQTANYIQMKGFFVAVGKGWGALGSIIYMNCQFLAHFGAAWWDTLQKMDQFLGWARYRKEETNQKKSCGKPINRPAGLLPYDTFLLP